MDLNVFLADYTNPQHARDIVALLDHYARDPMGGGAPLDDAVAQCIVNELAQRSFAFTVLCYIDDQAVGLVNCFESFSTFKARPLINIHDIVVRQDYRGRHISHAMLTCVEAIAEQRNCCRLTLEVLEGNSAAQAAYKKFGFAGYELDPQMGKALFWQKWL
jgi:ribosomal protein S18 acetylase RimI-like enzyme